MAEPILFEVRDADCQCAASTGLSDVLPPLALVTLSACGGGSSGSPAPAATATAAPGGPTLAHTTIEASRFLAQATFGTSRSEIDNVARNGIGNWLDSQFATSRTTTFFDRMETRDLHSAANVFDLGMWEGALWHTLMTGSDKLRHRVTLALLDIFTIGVRSLPPHWRAFMMANYLDVLADHAFGNFRDLLGAVTFSTGSGAFLTYLGSRKATSSGRRPDENYARELMQLFTIGLYELNEDGTRRANGSGFAVPSYSQTDVTELARVFTGLAQDGALDDHTAHRRQLRIEGEYNDTGVVSFLGNTISGGGTQAIGAALDVLFEHPNTAPFISHRLIQSLVTSNPPPAFVGRIARVFADNGRGERGDLRAVVRAILTDSDARIFPAAGGGRLRDPVQRFLNWARAFRVRDESGVYRLPVLLPSTGKAPGWSPNVFNFHQPDFVPPSASLAASGLVAPEFQIVSEQTALGYVNLMFNAVSGNLGHYGYHPDPVDFQPLANNPDELVEELSLVLAAGQLSAATKNIIKQAVSSIGGADEQLGPRRIQLATLMVFASPEYLVLE